MTVCSGSLPLDLTASSSLAVSWAAPEGEVIEMKGPSKIVDSWDGTEYPQQVEFEFQAMIVPGNDRGLHSALPGDNRLGSRI